MLRGCRTEFLACLSAEEIGRAERFRVGAAQEQFVVARGALRHIAASYLGVGARDIRFRYGAFGKPEIEGDAQFSFNVSHSHELVLIAASTRASVGVDVEYMRDNVSHGDLVADYFAAEDRSALAAVPAAERRTAFFQLWTAKEAVLKARGEGLAIPLDQVLVPLLAPTSVGTALCKLPQGGEQTWYVQALDVRPDYAAAVAANSPDMTVQVVDVGALGGA